MRIPPISILPLTLALIALVIAGYTTGLSMYVTIGLAAATVLVGIAVIFQYVGSPETKQVPLENFSLWADVGEPGAELKRLSPDDIAPAVRIASADLGSIATNAELLGARISLLVGREGFEGLGEEKLHRQVENIARDLNAVVKKLRATNGFPPKTMALLEQHAAQSDRIANKLFGFERGKSEVVHIYVEPLRRAAEKLSRDLRLASANMSDFVQGAAKETSP
ncbi:MAG: hypothetical protein QMD95_04580 [Candidatus Hodarchaeaceae archaeon]|nr:hypothetical protein [Candidatus Hodarchaeaceae archaeon]